MEELTDMADGEESGGVQVGQDLNQDVCRQPAERAGGEVGGGGIKHHKKEATPALPVLGEGYKCVGDSIKGPRCWLMFSPG